MKLLKPFRIVFWLILTLCLVFLVTKSSPAQADMGGSKVTFAPGAGGVGASCYIPNRYGQKLCFSLETITTDGEDVSAAYIKFPDDWTIQQSTGFQTISQSCTNGGTFGALWQSEGPYGSEVYSSRNQNAPDQCTAVYCWSLSTGATTTGEVSVPWIWFGKSSGAIPHHPCSNDNYYLGFPILGCDEHEADLPAKVPMCEHQTLTVLPETLPDGEVSTPYVQQLSPNGNNYSWSGNVSAMPAEFRLFDNGKIEWYSPQVAGSYNFTANVRGVNDWSDGSRTYTLVIKPKLVFSPLTLPYGREGQTYNQPITVSGGADPSVLTMTSGTLPTGMSFIEGAFTGTPTETGTFSGIVIQAVDQNGVTKTATYLLDVLPEHLFTWTPTTPTSYEDTKFTALAGFDRYDWFYERNGLCDNYSYDGPWDNTAMLTFHGKGLHKVCVKIEEYHPVSQVIWDEQWVTVTNSPPNVYYGYTYPNPSFPAQQVGAEAGFEDVDGKGAFTCEIDWGDGTPIDTGIYDPKDWSCAFPRHVYTAAGTYSGLVSVSDDELASDTENFTHNVVYLYAENDDLRLASNILTTKIVLRGYGPLGTETMVFNVPLSTEHGTLGTPVFEGCEPDEYRPAALCRVTVIFTPTISEPPYVGGDRFDYTVQDSQGHISELEEVLLWLDDNQPPTATEGSATVHATEPSSFTIHGVDLDHYDLSLDQLTFTIDTPPDHGTLSFEGDANISDWFYDGNWNILGAEWAQLLTYTPNPGNTATSDSFTFFVNDTHQNSTSATFNLTLHTPITLHVNNNDDNVDEFGCDTLHCSLREAVKDALIGDTVDFLLPPGDTITLIHGQLLINKNIQITGPGADQLTISAGFMDPEMNPNAGFRVLHFFNNYWPMKAELSGLTIRDGRSSEGGGVYIGQEVSLDMHDCVIGPNNIVSYAGGGISIDRADLTMTNCTVVGNHGTGTLGGAGVIADTSTLTMINSTITGNVTNNYGGGLLAYDESNVTLIHSTVSGNTANQNYLEEPWGGGGGIYNDDSTVTLHNSIVAGNIDLTDPDTAEHAKWPDVFGKFDSLTGNLIGDSTGSTGWLDGLGDMVGSAAAPLDPMFGVFGLNAPGHTLTYPLLPGSIAIDAVSCPAEVTIDQRGVTRPQGSACDSGAFELESVWRYQYLPLIRR